MRAHKGLLTAAVILGIIYLGMLVSFAARRETPPPVNTVSTEESPSPSAKTAEPIILYKKPHAQPVEVSPPGIAVPAAARNYTQMIAPRAVMNPKKTSFVSKLPENIVFDTAVQDATGHSNVKQMQVAAEVGVKLDPRSSVSLVTSQEFHNSDDAKVWKSSVEDAQTAEVKYKLNF